MLNIGILGAGVMGERYASIIQKKAGYRVIGITDPKLSRRDEIAEKYNVPVYEDIKKFLLNDPIDILIICLPPFLHTDYTEMALELNINVLCEKPMALSYGDCLKMLKAAEKSHAKLMVGQTLRFKKEYLLIKNLYDTGTFGKLLSFNTFRLGPHPRKEKEWINNINYSGGAVTEFHIHDSDFVNFVFGLPDSLSSSMVNTNTNPLSHITTIFHYPECEVVSEAGWIGKGKFPFHAGYRALFEEVSIVFNSSAEPSLTAYMSDGSVLTDPEVLESLVKNSGRASIISVSSENEYEEELNYFAACVEKGLDPLRCMPEDAATSVKITEAEKESAMKKSIVMLNN